MAIGPDVSLLSSGANLLTLAGYSADFVLSADDAARRVATPFYDLAIVSSSFAHDEQLAILCRLRQIRPNLPILLLGPEHDTPAAFLAAVADCLGAAKKPLSATPAGPPLLTNRRIP